MATTDPHDKRCDRCKEIEAGIEHPTLGHLDEVLHCSVCGDSASRFKKYLAWVEKQRSQEYDRLFS